MATMIGASNSAHTAPRTSVIISPGTVWFQRRMGTKFSATEIAIRIAHALKSSSRNVASTRHHSRYTATSVGMTGKRRCFIGSSDDPDVSHLSSPGLQRFRAGRNREKVDEKGEFEDE